MQISGMPNQCNTLYTRNRWHWSQPRQWPALCLLSKEIATSTGLYWNMQDWIRHLKSQYYVPSFSFRCVKIARQHHRTEGWKRIWPAPETDCVLEVGWFSYSLLPAWMVIAYVGDVLNMRWYKLHMTHKHLHYKSLKFCIWSVCALIFVIW